MKIHEPITINEPMVIIPVEEYDFLLREAGLKPTPKLNKEIQAARARFKQKKYTSWQKLKNEL